MVHTWTESPFAGLVRRLAGGQDPWKSILSATPHGSKGKVASRPSNHRRGRRSEMATLLWAIVVWPAVIVICGFLVLADARARLRSRLSRPGAVQQAAARTDSDHF